MPSHSGCCCGNATTCCDAWSVCPDPVYLTLSVGWSKSATLACDWDYLDLDPLHECTIPEGTEVQAQSFSLTLRRLRCEQAADGSGCLYYQVVEPGSASQPGTLDIVEASEGFACMDCDGDEYVATSCQCTIDRSDVALDGTTPDLTFCNWSGTIAVADASPGKCKATLLLSFDVCWLDAIDWLDYETGCVAITDSHDWCRHVELEMETPEYDEGSVPCPRNMTWSVVAMSVNTGGDECSCADCSTCVPDMDWPLVTDCPCPSDVTCEDAATWPCYDADFNGCGILSSGAIPDVVWCYSSSGPTVTFSA